MPDNLSRLSICDVLARAAGMGMLVTAALQFGRLAYVAEGAGGAAQVSGAKLRLRFWPPGGTSVDAL